MLTLVTGQVGPERPATICLRSSCQTTFGRFKNRPGQSSGRHVKLNSAIKNDISRFHAFVTHQPISGCLVAATYTLKDPGSLNGVLVNLVRVKTAVLKQGDRIAFGGSHQVAVGTRHASPDTLQLVYEFSDGARQVTNSPRSIDQQALVQPPTAKRPRRTPETAATESAATEPAAVELMVTEPITAEPAAAEPIAAVTNNRSASLTQTDLIHSKQNQSRLESRTSEGAGAECESAPLGAVEAGGTAHVRTVSERESALVEWESQRAEIERDLARREAELKAREANEANAGAAALAGKMAETELKCSICFDVIVCAHLLQCGHQFCYECITTWLGKSARGKKACPECRHDVTREPIPAVAMDHVCKLHTHRISLLLYFTFLKITLVCSRQLRESCCCVRRKISKNGKKGQKQPRLSS